jgi:hypothetical protein
MKAPRIQHLIALLSLLFLSLTLASCESTTAPNTTDNAIVKKPSVFILNEGQFGKSNATLDAISLSDFGILHNLAGGVLGDIGNDIKIINGGIYICLNGSNKILVIRPDSCIKLDSVTNSVFAPNQIAQVSGTRAIVTQLFTSNALIMDLQSNKIIGALPLGAGNSGIAVLNNRAWISSGSDSLNVVDLNTLQPTNIIHVGGNPQNVYADSLHDQIIVLGSGDYNTQAPGVYWVKATTMQKTDSTTVGNVGDQIGGVLGKDKFYVIYPNRIATYDLTTHALLADNFIGGTYYQGGYDAVNNELYLGNTKAYKAAGIVDVYDATSGGLKRSFTCGIAPAHFAFYR